MTSVHGTIFFLSLIIVFESYRPLKNSKKYPAITTIGISNPLKPAKLEK
jgi:hypothetical protein